MSRGKMTACLSYSDNSVLQSIYLPFFKSHPTIFEGVMFYCVSVRHPSIHTNKWFIRGLLYTKLSKETYMYE